MENIIANYGSSSKSEDEQVKTPRKLKAYSTEFEFLKVAKHAKNISIHGASNKFKVGRSTVRQWMRQEKQLHKIA
uniref:Brinker DNA-binding domain-containing protein n=1 Tax=Ditylenchus dipsaci TaxID=166011 RepID=A0A915CSR8_9BILA